MQNVDKNTFIFKVFRNLFEDVKKDSTNLRNI